MWCLSSVPGLVRPYSRCVSGRRYGRQAAIHLPRADRQQLALHGRAQPQPPARPRQPQRQQGLEPHRPGIARGLPDGPQGLDDRAGRRSRRAAPGRPRGAGRRPVEQPDGVLAVIARSPGRTRPGSAASPAARRLPIPLIDRLQVLPLALRTHDGSLHRLGKVTSQMARRSPLGNILDGAIRRIDPGLPRRLSSRHLSDRSRLRPAWRVPHAVPSVPARELLEGEVLRGVCHLAGSDLLELWYPALSDGQVLLGVRAPCGCWVSTTPLCFPRGLHPPTLGREDPYLQGRPGG